MLHQIKCLTAIQLCNICGLNVVCHGKDKSKRMRFIGMGIVYVLLMLVLLGYISAFTIGMVSLGIGEVVPYYLYLIVSLVILFFSLFKAAGIIFQLNTYELQVSLPVSKAAIVVSRFLTMYATDLLISMAVMIPGGILYGIMMKPSLGFYIWGITGILVLPCIPLTIATAAGSLVFAVSSRMKHKNLVNIFLSVGLVIVILGVDFGLTGSQESLEQFDLDMIRNLAVTIIEQVRKVYPPAGWFGNSVVGSNPVQGLWLIGSSLVSVSMLMAVLQKYFLSICSALNATAARNDYKMGSLLVSSTMKALWKREIKRYFASSVYVTNTIIGYILAVMAAVALWVVGADRILEMLQLPERMNLLPILPFVLTLIGNLMPMSSCSISMEGKQWWIAQTLPVSMKQILDGKILANLSIAFPFFAVAEIFIFLAVKPSVEEGIWLIVIPLVYTLFLVVTGLAVNLAVPVFDWENEVHVVKQSAATMLTLLTGMITSIIPIILLIMFGGCRTMINAVTAGIVSIATLVLYRRNQKATV